MVDGTDKEGRPGCGRREGEFKQRDANSWAASKVLAAKNQPHKSNQMGEGGSFVAGGRHRSVDWVTDTPRPPYRLDCHFRLSRNFSVFSQAVERTSPHRAGRSLTGRGSAGSNTGE